MTRHNAGFWLADHVADDLRASFVMEKGFSGFVAKARQGGDNVILLKPTTYMNRSGQSVGAVARFYKFMPEQILVLHDELDLMPGQVKLKQGGGHAGHNGLRDIQAVLGSPAFWRLRIGIGHPRTLGLAQPVADFVLHPPRREDMTGIEAVIDRCRAVMSQLLSGDFTGAIQQLHRDNEA
jgi:PTH1 family peptidyl-tRNA hydrolase